MSEVVTEKGTAVVAEAAGTLGSFTSPKKSRSSARNGKKGGRPQVPIEAIPCTCGRGDAVPALQHLAVCKRWVTAYQRERRRSAAR